MKVMKEVNAIAKAANFTAVDFGKMAELKDYVLTLSPEIKIPGKVFGGQSVNATGAEFSFQSLAPGQETGFLHTHKNFISSWTERASSKLTAMCSQSPRAAWSVSLRLAAAASATKAVSLSSSSASNTAARHSQPMMLRMV